MQAAILVLAALAVVSAQTELTPAFPQLTQRVQVFRATGRLTLNCTAVGVVSTPINIDSDLTNVADGTTVGRYTGPFTSTDGSSTRVVANGQFRRENVAGTLFSFLAVADRVDGTRTFDRIVLISRFNATGGSTDATALCQADTDGNLVPAAATVNFTADYGFYRAVQPLAGAKVTFRAVGTLNTTCSNGAYGAVTAINSTMSDLSGNRVGTYDGSFNHFDGSSTRAVSPVTSQIASGNLTLAYFVAQATFNVGNGVLNNITNITRYDTKGGVPIGTLCTASNEGTVYQVPFEATYGFYNFSLGGGSSGNTSGNTGGNTGGNGSGVMMTFSVMLVATLSLIMMMA